MIGGLIGIGLTKVSNVEILIGLADLTLDENSGTKLLANGLLGLSALFRRQVDAAILPVHSLSKELICHRNATDSENRNRWPWNTRVKRPNELTDDEERGKHASTAT